MTGSVGWSERLRLWEAVASICRIILLLYYRQTGAYSRESTPGLRPVPPDAATRVLYAFFASLVAEIIPEDISNHGQVDLTVKLAGYIYVIEIKAQRGQSDTAQKVAGEDSALTPNPALAQIQARGYSAKYRGLPVKGLFEVGLVFDPAVRNLAQADWSAVDAEF